MKKRSGVDMAASVRQRLLNLKEAQGADYSALLPQYAIERFLYRLSISDLADRFILKGAMLFRVWAEDLRRPTRDLDLLGFGEATPRAVGNAIRTILQTETLDDGLAFDPDSFTTAEIREGQEYGGTLPVGLSAKYGQDAGAQERWSMFLRRLQITDASDDLAAIVESVRSHVWPAIERARKMASR